MSSASPVIPAAQGIDASGRWIFLPEQPLTCYYLPEVKVAAADQPPKGCARHGLQGRSEPCMDSNHEVAAAYRTGQVLSVGHTSRDFRTTQRN